MLHLSRMIMHDHLSSPVMTGVSPISCKFSSPMSASYLSSWSWQQMQQQNQPQTPQALDSNLASVAKSASAMHTTQPESPKILNGRYRIDVTAKEIRTDLSTISFALDCSTSPPRPVVLKRIPSEHQALGQAEISFLNFIAQNNVPSTIRVTDSFVDPFDNFTVIVFPRLNKLDSTKLSIASIHTFLQQLLAALAKLHEFRIAHLDVTPSNIMCQSDGQITLIDFGLARSTKCGSHPACRGTQGFVAPELYSGMSHDTKPDIYSLGIVFGIWLQPFVQECGLELLGSKLVRGKVTSEIQRHLQERVLERFMEPEIPDVLYEAMDLLSKMIESDPCERISAEEASQHKFFCADSISLENIQPCACNLQKKARARRDADVEIIRYR